MERAHTYVAWLGYTHARMTAYVDLLFVERIVLVVSFSYTCVYNTVIRTHLRALSPEIVPAPKLYKVKRMQPDFAAGNGFPGCRNSATAAMARYRPIFMSAYETTVNFSTSLR